MKKIIVSAPGKLMLFGEHAVVYGHPCLVTAVNQRMYVRVEILDEEQFQLDAKDVKIKNYKKYLSQLGKGEIPDAAKFVEVAVKNFYEKFRLRNGIKVTTYSEFSFQIGFGSSSAITVCIIKALAELFNIKLSNKEFFDFSYRVVLDIQGKGSGFDIAAAIYGGTLYFQSGGKIIHPLAIHSLPLIVGYSGIKADTVSLINRVRDKFAKNNKRFQEVCAEIEIIVRRSRQEIERANWKIVGELMNRNQKLLSELGISTSKLDDMIAAAISHGAYGAKISGAGGGDCMIALASEDNIKSVERAITRAGGRIIPVETNAKGVKYEK